MALSNEHRITSRELFVKAEEALGQDDLLQASEKGWGAAAHLVKSVAEGRNWRHDGHRELYQAVNRLAQDTGDNQLRVLFGSASALHINFYENWLPKEMVEAYLGQVGDFLQKLEDLNSQH